MATSLPSPGHLIVENINLLAGSPESFQTRYGHQITATTFSKPGNTAAAHAILHFLITIIDGEVAESSFKPCFPILDREQERDFRKVVDTRLSILEKTKLLPVGAARKSIIAQSGGDRFTDLLWSLSALAVQQACLRHPAYGPVSRLRLVSQQVRSDSFTSQSSTRSSRSFRVGRSSRHDRSARPPRPEPSRQRRFLGAGMVSASQQRAKDAEEMRARIDAERATLARTTEMGKQGVKTWASEAASLRDKINDYEAKLRRMKGQLADMGFDENGVDIRSSQLSTSVASDQPSNENENKVTTPLPTGELRSFSSRDDLGEELKTSPIESTESCSSIDESMERVAGEIAADLNHLLILEAETRKSRTEIDKSLLSKKSVHSLGTILNQNSSGNSYIQDKEMTKCDVVELVRAATTELEQATSRMKQLEEQREQAKETTKSEENRCKESVIEKNVSRSETVSVSVSIQQTVVKVDESEVDNKMKSNEEVSSLVQTDGNDNEEVCSGNVEELKKESEISAPKDESLPKNDEEIISESTEQQNNNVTDGISVPKVQLEEKVSHTLVQHTKLIEATEQLDRAVDKSIERTLPSTEIEQVSAEPKQLDVDSDHDMEDMNDVSEEEWIEQCQKLMNETSVVNQREQEPVLDSVSELDVVFESLPRNINNIEGEYISSSNKNSSVVGMDGLTLDTSADQAKAVSSDLGTPDSTTSNHTASKMSRSVRFAELPPSYSASRSCDDIAAKASGKDTKYPSEVFPKSSRKQNRGDSSEESKSNHSVSPLSTTHKPVSNVGEVSAANDNSGKKSKREGRRMKAKGKNEEGPHSSQRGNRVQRTTASPRPTQITDVVAPHPAAPVTKSKQPTSPTPVSPPRRKTVRTARSYPPTSESSDVQPAAARRSNLRRGNTRTGVRVASNTHLSKRDTKEQTVVHSLSPSLQGECLDSRRVVSAPADVNIKKSSSESKSVSTNVVNETNEESNVQDSKDDMDDSKLMMAFTALNNSSMAMGSDTESDALYSIGAKATSEESINKDSTQTTTTTIDQNIPKFEVIGNESTRITRTESNVENTTPKLGIFVGHNTPWQHNIRTNSNPTERTSSRSAAISGGLFSRKSGRMNTQSPTSRKSKMQALRARLAALK